MLFKNAHAKDTRNVSSRKQGSHPVPFQAISSRFRPVIRVFVSSTYSDMKYERKRSQRSNVIPVVIARFPHQTLPPQLANIQWFDLTNGPLDKRLASLIYSLKTREME